MHNKKAIIGDIHGCLAELKELYAELRALGVEEFYHLGDLIDRGPDSPGVVRFCRTHRFKGVMGNHESSLLAMIERSKNPQFDPRALAPDKHEKWLIAKALDSEDLAYIRALPKLHVIADENLVLVHGGLWPKRELWEQDKSILYLRVINPARPGESRWLSRPGLYTMEENRAEGFAPWEELYEGPHSVVYGHSVRDEPKVLGRTVGIDTGCVYGGALTAWVLPDKTFVQVKAHKTYALRDEFA